MSNQNTKKSPGIKSACFTVWGEVGKDNFDCEDTSLSLFYFSFVTSLQKKFMTYVCFPVEPPPSLHLHQYAFSWTTPPPLGVHAF